MARRRVRDDLVTVFGGSGFLGRHVVQALARRGYRIRAAVRRPDLAGHLQTDGRYGQIHAVQANLRHRESIERAIAGADAVVNLVGILHESGRQRFDAVHEAGAGAVAAAARQAGIRRMAHVSSIGAGPESDSHYARSKAAGEQAVLSALPEAVIFRPSILMGPGDGFFNRFASMARISPVLPLIGGGRTLFQPAYVGDVAEAIALAIDGKARAGTTYELGGPEVRSFKELMEIMLAEIGRKRFLVPVPFALARLKARFLQLLPGPILTVDQVAQLQYDNVVSDEAKREKRTFQGLGIHPHAMATILPTYLPRYRRAGQFTRPDRDSAQA